PAGAQGRASGSRSTLPRERTADTMTARTKASKLGRGRQMGGAMLAGAFMDRGDLEILWIVERFIARGTVTTLWATQGRGKTHNMIRLVDAVAGNKDSFLGL